jgi:hypothetical protein
MPLDLASWTWNCSALLTLDLYSSPPVGTWPAPSPPCALLLSRGAHPGYLAKITSSLLWGVGSTGTVQGLGLRHALCHALRHALGATLLLLAQTHLRVT